MVKPVGPSKINTQIYEEACEWFVEMRAGDVDSDARREFNAWVSKSPEHLRAYLEVSEIWDDAPLVDPTHQRRPDDLIAEGRASADVIPLTGRVARTKPEAMGLRPFGIKLGRRNRNLTIAATLACCAVAAYAMFEHYRDPLYVTGATEQRLFRLEDGSRVELNSNTRLRVRFTDHARGIELLEGQALFQVAKSPERPFVVHVDGMQVRAVGTQFDIDRKSDATTVTVLEGRVVVDDVKPHSTGSGAAGTGPAAATRAVDSSISETTPTMLLAAGEQVRVTPDHRPVASRANLTAATAWTRGELVFSDSRLADVIEEFNRHNARRLVLRDASLESIRISGVYSSTNPDLLLRFLRAQPGIQVQDTGTEIVIANRKD